MEQDLKLLKMYHNMIKSIIDRILIPKDPCSNTDLCVCVCVCVKSIILRDRQRRPRAVHSLTSLTKLHVSSSSGDLP